MRGAPEALRASTRAATKSSTSDSNQAEARAPILKGLARSPAAARAYTPERDSPRRFITSGSRKSWFAMSIRPRLTPGVRDEHGRTLAEGHAKGVSKNRVRLGASRLAIGRLGAAVRQGRWEGSRRRDLARSTSHRDSGSGPGWRESRSAMVRDRETGGCLPAGIGRPRSQEEAWIGSLPGCYMGRRELA